MRKKGFAHNHIRKRTKTNMLDNYFSVLLIYIFSNNTFWFWNPTTIYIYLYSNFNYINWTPSKCYKIFFNIFQTLSTQGECNNIQEYCHMQNKIQVKKLKAKKFKKNEITS